MQIGTSSDEESVYSTGPIDEYELARSEAEKDKGVIIDNKLNFKAHL